MPHCIIEISKNIIHLIELKSLMKDTANAVFSLNCFNADDIKVRIIQIENSFMGIEEQDHAFSAAEIFIFDNKTAEQLHAISERVQSVMEEHLKNKHRKMSITTRISFLNKYYKKFKNF